MNEFLSLMKSNGALFAGAAGDNDILLTSNGLQVMRAAMLPSFLIDFFKNTGGIVLGNACIFGPVENKITGKYPIPSITEINKDVSSLQQMHGKTIFGRNDLFWFAFDAFGTCFMLDNMTLAPLRKYDDPWRAMTDCLVIGKF